MKFAAHTVLWGHSPADYERMFHVIRCAGFEGVELFQHSSKLGDPKRLLSLLGDITVLGLCTGSIADRIAWLKRAARVVPDFDPQSPYLFVDGWTERPDKDKRTMRDYLKDGWKIALHPYSLKKDSSFDDAFKALDLYPNDKNLLYLPDTAHAAIQAHEVAESISKYAARLAAIHLKDWRPGFGRVSARYAIGFTELGRGELELRPLLDALQQKEHDETWVVYVQDYTEGLREDSLKRSAAYLATYGLKERTSWSPQRSADFSPELSAKQDPLTPSLSQDLCAAKVRRFAGGRLTSSDVGRLYLRLAQSLRIHLGLKAVAVWSCSEIDMVKTLQGVSREDEAALTPEFDLSLVPEKDRTTLTLIGAPVTGHGPRSAEVQQDLPGGLQPVFTFGHFQCPLYRFPVRSRWNPFRTRIIIDLGFPSKATRDTFTKEKYLRAELAEAIIRSLDWHLESIMASAAADLNLLAARPSKLDDFTKDLLNLIKERMNCEDVFLFMTNDDSTRLVPFLSDRLIWSSETEKYYERGDGQETTEVWEELRPKFRNRDKPQPLSNNGKPPKSWSPGSEPDKQRNLLMPIVDTSGKSIGVVRCVNKRTANGLPCNFGDDDLLLLDHIMQHALPNLELRKADEQESLLRKQVEESNEKLNRTNAQLTDFITTFQHELKSPLTIFTQIRVRLQRALVRDGLMPRGGDFPKRLREHCEDTESVASRLAFITNSMELHPAELVRSPRFSECFKEIVAPILTFAVLYARNRSLDLRCNKQSFFLPVFCDPMAASLALHTLIDNAIKYADPETHITVEGTPRAEGCTIRVSNFGLGIPADDRERIFEKYYRSQGAKEQKIGGAGIGLYLAREIMSRNNGSVRLANLQNPVTFELFISSVQPKK